MNRKELLKLPEREWNKTTVYKNIAIVTTGKKHDSGWALLAIIGMDGEKPIEIAAYCDDVVWETVSDKYALRNDAFYPSGIIRYWSYKYNFEVGNSLSSTDVRMVPKKDN